jgi:hypothetical protein
LVKTVAQWLEDERPTAVAQIVQRICAELPAYRQRPADQLAVAAGAAYDQWRTTVQENDLTRYAREAEAVIAQSIAQGADPRQLARVPELICAVVVAMLDQAGPLLDLADVARFQARAQRMTASILALGGLAIARLALKKTLEGPDLPGL